MKLNKSQSYIIIPLDCDSENITKWEKTAEILYSHFDQNDFVNYTFTADCTGLLLLVPFLNISYLSVTNWKC